MKKVSMLLAVIFIMTAHFVNAQSTVTATKLPYTSAIGIKFFPAAISFKHYVKSKQSIELLAYFNEGTRFTALYEFSGTLSNTGNLQWYVGPGIHAHFYDYEHGGGSLIGVDGIIGLEYKISKLPIAISLDWQPSLEFTSNSKFSSGWGGIGGKFTF